MNDKTIISLLDSPEWPAIYKQQAARGIINELQALPYPAKGIEVGVNRGMNSWYMLTECQNISTLIGIDHYQPYVDWDRPISKDEQDANFRVITKNMQLMGDRFNLIKDSSQNAATKLDDDSYDFVFIDADHSLRAVLKDLDSYWPKVRSGGIIAGHDSNLFSVSIAVTSWTKHKGLQPADVKMVANNAWYFRKQ